jgi:ABC-type branched-subunit amino acid transport system ATPase component
LGYIGIRKVLRIEPFDIFRSRVVTLATAPSSGTSPAGAAIEARGVSKWFGSGEARTQALRDVSFETRFGEILYIIGPSGSGSTMLLSVISGILRPDENSVAFEEQDRKHFSLRKLAKTNGAH